MKSLFIISLSLICVQVQAQQHKMEKIWETDSIIATPESVLHHSKTGILYVAQIDGEPGGADGKGGIGKVGVDGKIIDLNWITGLNAPKGMAIHGNNLYVADLTEIIIIDLTVGKVEQKIAVDGAIFLNDVTADNKGIIYIYLIQGPARSIA